MLGESVSEGSQWRDPIYVTKELWMTILRDEETTTEKDRQLLELMYASDNCTSRAGLLAPLLNKPYHSAINSQVGWWGKRIAKKFNILVPRQTSEAGEWWSILFWGEGTKKGYYWTLRPELQEAISALHAMGEIFFLEDERSSGEIDAQSHKDYYEGALTQVYVNRHERNRDARDQCIKDYGARCVVCDFDFEKMYGKIGRGVIHVHHLKPLSDVGESYKVDPRHDLRPVCPNCHVMIHKKNPPYSIAEVTAMIRTTRIE